MKTADTHRPVLSDIVGILHAYQFLRRALRVDRDHDTHSLAQLRSIIGSEKKLENKNFVEKAPADVVQRERDRLEDMKVQAEKIKKQIQDFG